MEVFQGDIRRMGKIYEMRLLGKGKKSVEE